MTLKEKIQGDLSGSGLSWVDLDIESALADGYLAGAAGKTGSKAEHPMKRQSNLINHPVILSHLYSSHCQLWRDVIGELGSCDSMTLKIVANRLS